MADEKISAMDPAQLPNEADLYPIVQSAQNRKQTLTQLRNAIGANIVALAGLTGAADQLAYFTGVGAQALTPLSSFMRTVLSAASAAAARTTLGVQNVSPGFIEGLNLQWAGANAVTVNSGAAYLNGAMVQVPSAIATTGMTLTAATWYHCYLYLNAGAPAVEFVTTAPSAKVFGTARTKTGDTTRRYLGSIRSGAANTVLRFVHSGGRMNYLSDTSVSPFALLTLAQAIVSTLVDTTNVAPLTATHLSVVFTTSGSGSGVLCVNNPDMGTVSASNALLTMAANATTAIDFPLPVISAQSFVYTFTVSPGSGGAYARAYGYLFER